MAGEPGRRLLALALLALTVPAARPARADEAAAWEALRRGGIVLFRHALAPGVGDPAGMRLGDCATQRILSDEGRRQAMRIGEALRERAVAVGAVLASQWCRTRETAALAFPGEARDEPIFNSFFSDRSTAAAQTEAARRLLLAWQGPGALVVSTHQVNIAALTGISPASGEGVVLAVAGESLVPVGRIRP